MAFCQVFVILPSFYRVNVQNSSPFFSFFFFLSFGFIKIELNRTWERKKVSERERASLAKKGGEAKKKRKRREDEKAVGACNDTWLCVSRKREKESLTHE